MVDMEREEREGAGRELMEGWQIKK